MELGININSDECWTKYYDPETGVQYFKVCVGAGQYQIIPRQGKYESMANEHSVTIMDNRIVSVNYSKEEV